MSEPRTLTSADVEAIVDALAARPATSDPRPFYTARTLADKLGVSSRTVHALLANGTIPSYKIESSRRIAPADVDAYLARCREERAA